MRVQTLGSREAVALFLDFANACSTLRQCWLNRVLTTAKVPLRVLVPSMPL